MKINNTQQNSKFSGDRNETINHISENSKLEQKKDKTRDDGDGEGDSLGFMQEIEIWPYYRIVYAQTRILPGEWDV